MAAVYDGHTILFGMDMDSDPRVLPITQVSKAVNRRFRGGKNRQRPPFRQITLNFENEDDRPLFERGNVQMVKFYEKKRIGRTNGLIVSIAGTIFFISLVNENGYVSKVATGNNPRVMHAFGEQAEEWYYIQDGEHQPIFWNGLAESRRSVEADKEMPIGTIMCYCQGRMFVTNAYNQMVASDIMFGKGFTRSDNVQKFTETLYWNEGGYFLLPSSYGPITGAAAMPAPGVNLRGEGELVIFGENGAHSFDVGVPRQLWKDTQIQKATLKGRGCIAPDSISIVSNEIWYKIDEGWSSYSSDRSDLSQRRPFRKISRPVNDWLDRETKSLRRYASHIFFDNRILGAVSPQVSLPRDLSKGYGSHRYFRGIIALDMDAATSESGGNQANFDGLWTGIRPTGMAVVADRAFAMSYDSDGVNRLYEITREVSGNDNGKKKVLSHYVSRQMMCPPSGEFNIKRMAGGELWISEVHDKVGARVSYRADNSPCWLPLDDTLVFGSNAPQGPLPFTRARHKKWILGSPDPDLCQEGTDSLASTGSTFQVLVELEGNMKVDRFRIKAETLDEAEVKLDGDCPRDDEPPDLPPILCESENDYKYLIVNG